MGARRKIITTFFAFQQRDCDEEQGSLYASRHDRDRNFLDELCREIHDLPSVRAAIESMPGLASVPIFASYKDDGSLGGYTKRGIDINLALEENETMDPHFEVQLTTLPHELRHKYQDARGCMSFLEDARVKPHLEDHILFERIVEADATAFSLTAMYELAMKEDNYEPLYRAWEVHRGSVEAYLNAAGHDEGAHWSGEAAQTAFEAYFWDDNKERLERYDLRLCCEFFRVAQSEKTQNYRIDVPQHIRHDLFMDYLKPISRMPYVDQNGEIVERPAYQPERCDNIMAYLSYETQRYIEESRRILALS